MMRLGGGLLASFMVIQGCGGSGGKCLETTADFSPAAITVDPAKRMADLTADERAAACAELSRALTASFGSLEVGCKFGSHSGTRQGMPSCQAWYDDCLQMPPPTDVISGCTEKMSGMWNCPITIGQYQACFNDLNGGLLTAVENATPCGGLAAPLCAVSPPSCATAACDYTWYD